MVRLTPVPKSPASQWRRLDPLVFPSGKPQIKHSSQPLHHRIINFFFQGRDHLLKPVQRLRQVRHISGRKTAGIVILLLLLLLVFTAGSGILAGRRKEANTRLDASLSEITHKFEEGVALVDLNPIRARALLGEAKELLETELQISPSGKTGQKLSALLKEVDESLAVAVRRYEVTPNSYFELGLIKPQAVGDQLSLYQDALVVLDRKNQAVYRLSLSSKSARILGGGSDFSGSRSIAVHGEEVYVLTDAVSRVILPDGRLEQIVPMDSEWGKIVAISAYAGNLYLLDTEKNQVWKYIRTETGFSSRQDYLLFDALIDLSRANQMVIDGYVWAIKDGNIMRFSQGQEYPWKIGGLDEPLGSALGLYTDDTTKNIYILDKDHRRVVVADKDGAYLAQYSWRENLPVSDMVVSEVIKKILLLSGDTIYGIDLQ